MITALILQFFSTLIIVGLYSRANASLIRSLFRDNAYSQAKLTSIEARITRIEHRLRLEGYDWAPTVTRGDNECGEAESHAAKVTTEATQKKY